MANPLKGMTREQIREKLKEQAKARRAAKAVKKAATKVKAKKAKQAKRAKTPLGARKETCHNEVRQLFDYRDGQLFWRVKVWTNVKPGDRAGCLKKSGYRTVTINGETYFEHRLIYQWHHDGTIPDYIDHINGVRDDNRIENLRASDQRLNQGNRKAQKSTSQYKGVRWDFSGWRAAITVNQKEVSLGRYRTEEEAARAYNRRAIQVFGEHALLNQILDKHPEDEAV